MKIMKKLIAFLSEALGSSECVAKQTRQLGLRDARHLLLTWRDWLISSVSADAIGYLDIW